MASFVGEVPTTHGGVYSAGASGADFSQLFKQSGGSCQFSPSGMRVATAVQHRLTVRDAETLQIEQLYSCVDAVDSVVWSPDSKCVLCLISVRSMVQVFSVLDPSWNCRINEGVAGLVAASWAPSSRHILTTTDFQLHMTVWSLIDRSSLRIPSPKLPASGCPFTADGALLAVPSRRECKDHVTVYDAQTWEVAARFPVDSMDLEEVVWSPDGSCLCVRDTPLEFRVMLYTAQGQLLSQYRAYENALGVKSVSWSPEGELLAIGSYDEEVRLLNALTWKGLAEFKHSDAVIKAGGAHVDFYQERLAGDDAKVEASVRYVAEITANATRGGRRVSATPAADAAAAGAATSKKAVGLPSSRDTDYETEVRCVPHAASEPRSRTVTIVAPDPTKPNPRLGVGLTCWSACGRYLASRNDNMPYAVWVWDKARFALAAVLEFRCRVLSAKWDPARTRLAVITGTNKLFLWTPSGTTWVQVPAEGWGCKGLRWNPLDGNSVLLLSKQRFTVCFLAPEAGPSDYERARCVCYSDAALRPTYQHQVHFHHLPRITAHNNNNTNNKHGVVERPYFTLNRKIGARVVPMYNPQVGGGVESQAAVAQP